MRGSHGTQHLRERIIARAAEIRRLEEIGARRSPAIGSAIRDLQDRNARDRARLVSLARGKRWVGREFACDS